MTETKEKSPSEIHKDHRARRKLTYLEKGFEAFSDIEKLEFILFYAINQKDTNPIAHRLLDTFGSFKNVIDAPVHSLAKVKGMGMHSAILINLFSQTFSAYSKSSAAAYITSALEAEQFVEQFLQGQVNEVFLIICLSNKGKVLLTKTITSDSSNKVNADIKYITEAAFNVHASKVIIAHNHPNGTPTPSDEDIAYTSYAFISLLFNDIDLIDHVITSEKGTLSMVNSKIFGTIRESSKTKLAGNKKLVARLAQRDFSYL